MIRFFSLAIAETRVCFYAIINLLPFRKIFSNQIAYLFVLRKLRFLCALRMRFGIFVDQPLEIRV